MRLTLPQQSVSGKEYQIMMTMTNITTLTKSRPLEACVAAVIEKSIRPSFTQPFEYIRATANNQGEVHLSGLVHDLQLAEDTARLVREIPGVRFVFNDVSILCVGCAIEL
jgi:hypothetical protein